MFSEWGWAGRAGVAPAVVVIVLVIGDSMREDVHQTKATIDAALKVRVADVPLSPRSARRTAGDRAPRP